ncbi:hypothetical protein HJG60_010976 [Phyllostomus discolor]|uniref:Uncharacterized protein n=1 Tax=Phyllostomus discolor TaxID=89673 RepID=A0A834A801_9CHIR|nr:hypothetical protein HJG60_010976 [Phyllostomus discolor]
MIILTTHQVEVYKETKLGPRGKHNLTSAHKRSVTKRRNYIHRGQSLKDDGPFKEKPGSNLFSLNSEHMISPNSVFANSERSSGKSNHDSVTMLLFLKLPLHNFRMGTVFPFQNGFAFARFKTWSLELSLICSDCPFCELALEATFRR